MELKYDEIKNWEALKDVIKSNEYVIGVGACSSMKRDELIKETEYLKGLLKKHEEEK